MQRPTKTASGIELVEARWGGFYRGGAYLVTAPTAGLARVLMLRALHASVQREETCLYISAGRPEGLAEQAQAVGLDVRAAHASGLLRLLRFPPPESLRGLADEARPQTLADLAGLIRRHHPHRVVLDDLLPFIAFRDAGRLRPAFMQMLAQLDPLGLTLLLACPAPTDAHTQTLLGFIAEQMTGELAVEAPDDAETLRLRLVPRLGHDQHEGVATLDPVAFPRPHLAPAVPRPRPAPVPAFEAGEALEWTLAEAPFEAPPVRPDTDRDAFVLRLHQRFQQHALRLTPFLLIALRADTDAARGLDFDLLCRCAHALLAPADDVLVEPERRRLVVVLAHSDEHAGHRFFARLRARLRDQTPEAGAYLQAVTAIVAPNGGAYLDAEEFILDALEG